MKNVLVLGAGPDELVAAHVLARSGREVVVVEEREGKYLGPGWLAPALARVLGVESVEHNTDPWMRSALPEGAVLELWHDIGRSTESIRRFSRRDAEKWPQFCERLYLRAPVDSLDARLAFRVRGLGRRTMEDLMRILPMSVADLLDDWFESDALKGALGTAGILNLCQGPRSGGTAFNLLHHHVGSRPGVFRPARSNFCARLKSRGGLRLRRGRAAKFEIRQGRIHGIVLGDGETLEADLVVSGADPRRTLLELGDPGWLDPQLVRALLQLRSRGVTAKLAFQAPSMPERCIAPSLDYLERAYDDAKYGRVSRAPYLDIRHGAHVEVHFQYAPYRLAEGDWDSARRERLAEAVRALVPELGNAPAKVLSPPDLEAEEGWPRGQPYHAEMGLDQSLWMRPLPALSDYQTPIEGLWLCGPAMHPGIPGISGYNCARRILGELK